MTDIMKTKIVHTPICVGKVCNFCGSIDTTDFPSGGDMVIECTFKPKVRESHCFYILSCMYGSKYDEQHFHFWVCDECIEKLFYGKENQGNIVK